MHSGDIAPSMAVGAVLCFRKLPPWKWTVSAQIAILEMDWCLNPEIGTPTGTDDNLKMRVSGRASARSYQQFRRPSWLLHFTSPGVRTVADALCPKHYLALQCLAIKTAGHAVATFHKQNPARLCVCVILDGKTVRKRNNPKAQMQVIYAKSKKLNIWAGTQQTDDSRHHTVGQSKRILSTRHWKPSARKLVPRH